MCHVKEIGFGLKNKIYFEGYATSFSGEPPFQYAQSGSERTSFSGSTIRVPRRWGEMTIVMKHVNICKVVNTENWMMPASDPKQ